MHLIAKQIAKRPQFSLGVAVAAFFVATPAILFYAFLFQTALDLPFYDDYDATLDFMNRLVQLDGLPAKLSYFFASQHNEYKLFLEQAVVWLQFALLGHINFSALCAIGNAFLLPLGLLLWKIFLPTHANLAHRLALFIPVPWLLFQLQYHETVNWAMAGLQNLPILFFSFASIYFLLRATRLAFCAALLCFILAVATSGNGFLMLPIGLLILAIARCYRRIAAWLLVSAACIAVYAYRYNVMSSQSAPHRSVFSTLTHLRPAYAISFMGSAASIPLPAASFVLGTALCIFFAWMAFRGYIRRNPLVSYCVLFLLLTAIGVAGIRSDLGLTQSLSSRYTIYSALFLIFAWFILVEEFLQHRRVSLLNNGAYLSAVAAAILFAVFMDAVGCLLIERQDRLLIQGMTSFEHPATPGSTEGPDIPLLNEPAQRALYKPHARAVLIESIRLGVYHPPPY